ncbi:MAG: glycosyltransferase [Hymenobacter sp.]|nr:MAG: glycosyltransferase [Hymenobacter sp.]
MRRLLCGVAQHTAQQLLCVSEHVRTTLALPNSQQQVVHNALPASFIEQANRASLPYASPQPFVVLMACSLRDYKGVPEFFALARSLPEMSFELVLNASAEAVATYASQHLAPANLTLFSAAHNMHPHYQRAAVVVNLSRPDEWVETFGMTILEAMAYGRPVIVPPVGGVAEVNVHAHTGFAIDGRNLPALQTILRLLQHNGPLYARMAAAARLRADAFSPARFAEQLVGAFRHLLPVAGAPSIAAPSPATPTSVTQHQTLASV